MLVALILAVLALPGAAGAQVVPPGNSGVDQYQESIPGAGGNRPTGPTPSDSGKASATANSSGGAESGAKSRIAPSTAKQLDKLGPDGKATAAVAAATAPGPSRGSGGPDSSGDTGPGMGWALPTILVLTLAGAVSIAVFRWRRGAPPGTA
jgi:hypothetical protein